MNNDLKELRYKYNLTQSQLSALTGIPFRTIQNWECGQRKCPEYLLNLICFFIEVTNYMPKLKNSVERGEPK